MSRILRSKMVTQQVEMNASHNLNAVAEERWAGEDTVSLKMVNRIIGLRDSDDATYTFIASMLNKMGSLTGSFSVKLPMQFAENHMEELVSAVEKVHKYMDWMLTEGYNQLSEEDKAVGKKIAEQNLLRSCLIEKNRARSDAAQYVNNYMDAKGLLIVPNGAQLESTIVSGTLMQQNPGTQGFKLKKTQEGAFIGYVKNGEIFGRKRVPLKNDQVITLLLGHVMDFAQNWEDYWKAAPMSNETEILTGFTDWASRLGHQDHEIVVDKLSDSEVEAIKKRAADMALEM